MPSVRRIDATWDSTVRTVTPSVRAIAAFERPSATPASTSSSRSVSSASRALLVVQHASDDAGVDGDAAVLHGLDGLDEAIDVGHAVFQQVADPVIWSVSLRTQLASAYVDSSRMPSRGWACRAATAARTPSSVKLGGSRTSSSTASDAPAREPRSARRLREARRGRQRPRCATEPPGHL